MVSLLKQINICMCHTELPAITMMSKVIKNVITKECYIIVRNRSPGKSIAHIQSTSEYLCSFCICILQKKKNPQFSSSSPLCNYKTEQSVALFKQLQK